MKNVVVLVADSLRYDSVPESIVKESSSEVIPTLAPSLHTPTSFASLFTSREPQDHNVRSFMEDLDPDLETAFDRFPNTSFYDGPSSSINKHIFRSEGKDLEDMEEPFIWVERVMDTHIPYDRGGHERDYEFEESGKEYVERMVGEGRLEEEYGKGVDILEEHFFRHVEELEDRGILDDTVVVLTSDHGDLLGERFLMRKRYEHNYPPLRNLVQVPTVFYSAKVEADAMRLVDVIPTALGIAGRDPALGDGVDVRELEVAKGRNVMEDVKANFDTAWRFNGDHWKPAFSSLIQIYMKTLVGDLKRSVYRKGYRPLEEKLESKQEDELEGVDI